MGLDGACVGVFSGVTEFVGVDCLGLARRMVPVSPTKGLGGGGRDARLNDEPDSSGVLHTGSSPGAGGGGSESRERFDRNISGGGGGSGSLSDSASSMTLDGDGGGGKEVIESICKITFHKLVILVKSEHTVDNMGVEFYALKHIPGTGTGDSSAGSQVLSLMRNENIGNCS